MGNYAIFCCGQTAARPETPEIQTVRSKTVRSFLRRNK